MEPQHDLRLDTDLTLDQQAIADALTPSQLADIDTALLRAAQLRWRKLAMVVATAMYDLPERIDGLPDVFYARRAALLVDAGTLEARGDLRRMRYSEVRLPESRQSVPGA